MILLVMLYQVVLNFQFIDEIVSVVIKIKATEQCFPMVQFIYAMQLVGSNF